MLKDRVTWSINIEHILMYSLTKSVCVKDYIYIYIYIYNYM